MRSLCIVVDLHVACNNIKACSVAMKTQQGSLITAVELQNISYCCQQYEHT